MPEKKKSKIFNDGNARILRSGLKGGVGGAAKQYAMNKANSAIDRAAQKTAAEIAKRKSGDQETSVESGGSAPKKKMTGPFFYIVLVFVIIEDLLDIIAGLSVILAFTATVTSLFITFVVFTYLYLEKINWESRKLVMWAISFIMELLPFFSMLPTYTIIFVLTRILENSPDLNKKLNEARNQNITRSKRG